MWMRVVIPSCPMIDTEIYLLACEDIVILYAFDAASPHGLLDMLQESIPVLGHFRGGFCEHNEETVDSRL